jgi:hypothetical protein
MKPTGDFARGQNLHKMGETASGRILFVYDEVNDSPSPFIADFREAFVEKGIPFRDGKPLVFEKTYRSAVLSAEERQGRNNRRGFHGNQGYRLFRQDKCRQGAGRAPEMGNRPKYRLFSVLSAGVGYTVAI